MNESDDEYVNDAIDNMTLELTGAPRLKRALFAASWERMILIAELDAHTSGGMSEDSRRTRAARLMLQVMELHHFSSTRTDR